MALQSVVPIPQLVHCSNNGRSPAQPFRNGLFVVDFVGLYCKSKRTRRKFGASEHRSFPQFISRNYSVKAVLDLGRSDAALDQSAASPSSDLKPKVADLHDIIAERGACGVGFIANLENKASHGIIEDALTALGCMEHRGGCGADNDSGDGSD
ncbi:ferredoxin-dependent glutamate synthase chloroplastic [Prunus yedoensis var. nudiflora]|uniref:glutamate synthase (ferredoxin) n=1 Tax=Prunus yedoensis var. nudiflora TaxID=2094558 RepID=A0A314Y859_PRUYE|nr:ferredoxin-dependent glutamate synthase chloroplastic [Prunus yedoensis var. nudiflora]